MVHIRVLADKRIDDMEKTMSVLAEQVARLECELNNLESIDGDNVCDKVRRGYFKFKFIMVVVNQSPLEKNKIIHFNQTISLNNYKSTWIVLINFY